MSVRSFNRLNIFFAILFILFALLQINDPDPVFWILIYSYSAILCLIVTRRPLPKIFIIAGIVVYTIHALWLFFTSDGVLDWLTTYRGQSIVGEMHATKPWIEYTRDFFGLIILIAVLSFDYFYLFKRRIRVADDKLQGV